MRAILRAGGQRAPLHWRQRAPAESRLSRLSPEEFPGRRSGTFKGLAHHDMSPHTLLLKMCVKGAQPRPSINTFSMTFLKSIFILLLKRPQFWTCLGI